jgi:translation initiation factor IF-1
LLARSAALRGGLQSVPIRAFAAIVLPLILIRPLYDSATMDLLRSEQNMFQVFWRESMARHAQLRLASEDSIIVPNRTARPSVLMAEDLSENPNGIPNDCIGRFYGKKAVAINLESPDRLLEQLPAFLSEIRHRVQDLPDGPVSLEVLKKLQIGVPESLNRETDRLASPWGSVALFKRDDQVALDFSGVSHRICPPLLYAASQFHQISRISVAGSAGGEQWAPLTEQEVARECGRSFGFMRLISVRLIPEALEQRARPLVGWLQANAGAQRAKNATIQVTPDDRVLAVLPNTDEQTCRSVFRATRSSNAIVDLIAVTGASSDDIELPTIAADEEQCARDTHVLVLHSPRPGAGGPFRIAPANMDDGLAEFPEVLVQRVRPVLEWLQASGGAQRARDVVMRLTEDDRLRVELRGVDEQSCRLIFRAATSGNPDIKSISVRSSLADEIALPTKVSDQEQCARDTKYLYLEGNPPLRDR